MLTPLITPCHGELYILYRLRISNRLYELSANPFCINGLTVNSGNHNHSDSSRTVNRRMICVSRQIVVENARETKINKYKNQFTIIVALLILAAEERIIQLMNISPSLRKINKQN